VTPEYRNNLNNRILLSFNDKQLERLQPHLRFVDLARGDVIGRIGDQITHVTFLNRGLASAIKTMRDGRVIEVSAVGTDGAIGMLSVFGIDRFVFDSAVQIPGSAFLVEVDVLKAEAEHDPALAAKLRDYISYAAGQLSQTAGCNRFHSLEQRCCRWLLIANDSFMEESFPITHEFLAMMLGVRREAVSLTLGGFKKAGWIDYIHGKVTILDRTALEAGACECYADMTEELNRLFS